jgi:hypothetical protein
VALHHEVLPLAVECRFGRSTLELGAAASLLERLQPQALGGMGDRFREAVQGGGAGVEAAGEAAPPLVEQRVDGVRGAATDVVADFLDGGTLARAEQSVGGAVDVGGSDAAGGRRRL